jgi:type II secretory pathway pseudopilin PulG
MKKRITKTKHQRTRGVTIIETMISVSIFLIIITIGTGSLLSANAVHNKSRDLRSILDSLNFAMEDMSRNLRTGYRYRCLLGSDSLTTNLSTVQSCPSGWGIAFESATGTKGDDTDQWVYYINSNGELFRSTDGGTSYVQLTPPEVELEIGSSFSVLGAGLFSGGDEQQALVNIKLVGKVYYKNTSTPFYLQTSVSQRLLDI